MANYKTGTAIVLDRVNKMEESDCHADSLLLHSLQKTQNTHLTDKIVTALFLETGAVQGLVMENNRVIFKFGPAFVPSMDMFKLFQPGKFRLGGFKILGDQLELYGREYVKQRTRFVILALFPGNRDVHVDSFKKLVNFMANYHLNEKKENIAMVKNLFAATVAGIESEFDPTGDSSVAILKLQNLKPFIKLTGPYKSRELFLEIRTQVREFLGHHESSVYLIDEKSVVILMKDLPRDEARAILEEMFINVNSLIIDYNLYVYGQDELKTTAELFSRILRISG